MIRRRALNAVAVMAALLTGCSAADSAVGSSGTVGQPVTITWLAFPFNTSGNDPRVVIIDQFERMYPSIRVILIEHSGTADNQRDVLTANIADRTGVPDVYLGDVIWPATLAHAGVALPLSDHLPKAFWKRFAPGVLPGVTYNGKIYAAPFAASQGLLYYRKDLLALHHLPVPETWEQLVDEAQAITATGQVKYGFVWQGAPNEGLACVWTEVMRDAGGQALNRAGTRSLINSPQSLAALRFLLGLVRDGVTPPEVATWGILEAISAFDSGQAAFARQWNSAYLSALASPIAADVGVAPLPTFAGSNDHYSTSGGSDVYINPYTRNMDAALTFVRWLTDVQAQEIMASAYSMIPANDVVRNDPRIMSRGPVLSADSRSTPVSRPANTPAYTAVSRAIFTNVHDALVGALTPEGALQTADRQINAAVAGSP
jgi:multiple sugar transport system substrate-binding protein